MLVEDGFKKLESLVPSTTVDMILSTGIRKFLIDILLKRNLRGEKEREFKNRANDLLDKYSDMILKSGVRGTEKAYKAEVMKSPVGLRDTVIKSKIAERSGSHAELIQDLDKHIAEKEAERKEKGRHPKGYAKTRPMGVVGTVAKPTTGKPVTVNVKGVLIGTALHSRLPAQYSHAVQSSQCGRNSEHETKNEKVEQKAVEPKSPEQQNAQGLMAQREQDTSPNSQILPRLQASGNAPLSNYQMQCQLHHEQYLKRSKAWQGQNMNEPVTAPPATAAPIAATTTPVLPGQDNGLLTDSRNADREVEQEQDEVESEYEVVDGEKEDGDDWIVVDDDTFPVFEV